MELWEASQSSSWTWWYVLNYCWMLTQGGRFILWLINKFRGKVCMFICDCNNILQACWVSIGSDVHEILPSCVHQLQRYVTLIS